ncbi:MAG: hypothetical protein OXE93_07260 [bacterium]|nr:hypothetical protein [bacterium]MCY4256795.1 hypothetical protein [bacterium]
MIEHLLPKDVLGIRLLRANWVGTGAFVVVATATTVFPSFMAVSMALFSFGLLALGSWAMLWAFSRAVQRSRYELIGVGGLYFLAGCAPQAVRRSMLAALGVQSLVAVAAASVRPFSASAFGILVPVYALGLSGVWGARYGNFPDRPLTDANLEPRNPNRNGNNV